MVDAAQADSEGALAGSYPVDAEDGGAVAHAADRATQKTNWSIVDFRLRARGRFASSR